MIADINFEEAKAVAATIGSKATAVRLDITSACDLGGGAGGGLGPCLAGLMF